MLFINFLKILKFKRLEFTCPTRGLIGFRSELLNETKGTALMESELLRYEEH